VKKTTLPSNQESRSNCGILDVGVPDNKRS
jgi:hypothetical protein